MPDIIGSGSIDDMLRDRIYKRVFEEFVGPMDAASKEVITIPPTLRYSAGVLHPRGLDLSSEACEGDDSAITEECDYGETSSGKEQHLDIVETGVDDIEGASDEPIALSNAMRQSALSMTVAVRDGDRLSYVASCARYESVAGDSGNRYRRVPLTFDVGFDELPLPREPGGSSRHWLVDSSLYLQVVFRRRIPEGLVVTVALCNNLENKRDSCENCFFQASVKVVSELGLVPPVWSDSTRSGVTEEEASHLLIYRDVRNYAVGHGCATRWEEGEKVTWAQTEVMPVAETRSMKPMHPSMEGLALPLKTFGDPDQWCQTLLAMREMCHRYKNWIAGVERDAGLLPDEHRDAAANNLSKCRACLARMEDGIDLLEHDEHVRDAFVMTNEAMYEQYLHYSVVSGERASLDAPVDSPRCWRPFQLAFIIMNLRSIVDEGCSERGVVDLIWFPTGGGKTEAYLGLTAFTLIYERLSGTTASGVSVFMRYTLRLLTSQQFDRASSLICALESMRRRRREVLGERTFRIGLWVGGEASPNTRENASDALNKYLNSKECKNPFPVRRCPWCGADMEEWEVRDSAYIEHGKKKRIVFACPNSECEFSDAEGLPLDVVDEDIYERPPSLLVGTVDKFAMLPYRPEALVLFGIQGGSMLGAPKLIIQDELHLISGPLGSMCGHYETLVSTLCEREGPHGVVKPKIVASTATVSRAKEQCNQLYACGKDNVFQFPPAGIDHGDSFFAVEDTGARGRRYVGVFVPTVKDSSASIQLYSDLLWEPASWKDVDDEWRDRYWTTIGYFGTTRELGQAVTWMGGSIPERLRELRNRSNDGTIRWLNEGLELTGRKSADEVRSGLGRLSVSYPQRGAVDLCFATNMISVGLDVGRLGLMVVTGQPKSTAEYIQATSRVGRGDAKGIVFVVYSPTRPRDRSHYENFAMFHKSFYQNVEPSSVTSFCRQVRNRALFGTLEGIYRSALDGSMERPPADPDGPAFDRAVNAVIERVAKVDPEEREGTREDIQAILDRWRHANYGRWMELGSGSKKLECPLMRSPEVEVKDEWEDSFVVPTSMRSVDSQCVMMMIKSY